MPPISFGVSFLAGLASFVSPCYLPLIPSYMGYLAGNAGTGIVDRRRLILNTLAFVAGFSLVFTLLGLSSTVIGNLLLRNQRLLRYVGGTAIALMGLQQLGILRLSFLQRQWRLTAPGTVRTWVHATVAGAAFGIGWTPCIGPTLGAILVYAGTSGTSLTGALLLLAFSLGLGVPFLGSALLADRLSGLTRRLGPYLPWVERVGGVLLVLLGIAIATNWIARLSGYVWWTI